VERRLGVWIAAFVSTCMHHTPGPRLRATLSVLGHLRSRMSGRM
jgi:hypothetical protein